MPIVTWNYVIEVLITGFVLGEETINRFFYATMNAPIDTLDDFLTEFGNTVLTDVLAIMSNQSGFSVGTAQFVKGGTAFASKIYAAAGNVSGDVLPPFVAWDFTLLRGGARERNGYKRFAGVPESYQANGNPTTTAAALAAAAAVTMGSTVSTANDTWDPVIQRTVVNHIPQHPPVYYDISNVIFSRIGSQNSRKQGHGR